MNRRLAGDAEFCDAANAVKNGVNALSRMKTIDLESIRQLSNNLDSLANRFGELSEGADRKVWSKAPQRSPDAVLSPENRELVTKADSLIKKVAERKKGLDDLKSEITGYQARDNANAVASEYAEWHKAVKKSLPDGVKRDELLGNLAKGEQKFKTQAQELLIKHSLSQAPTEESVVTLLKANKIKVGKVRKLPHATNKHGETDIVIEYEFAYTGKPDAYAYLHVHYNKQNYRLEEFVKVHFKKPGEHLKGGPGVYRQSLTTWFIKEYLTGHTPS